MKKLLMIIASILLLGTTGCNNYKSKIDKAEIPNLQIKCNNKNLTVEKVSSKDKLLMQFTKEPTNVSVILWENEEKEIKLKDNINYTSNKWKLHI